MVNKIEDELQLTNDYTIITNYARLMLGFQNYNTGRGYECTNLTKTQEFAIA